MLTTYLANPAIYVAAYLFFMVPTYVLPYFGSNSAAARLAAGAAAAMAGASTGQALMAPFYAHLICLLILCGLVFIRGKAVGKTWLLVFPILALVFDMVPVLNLIPLIPTVMHLLAIILAVAGARTASTPRSALVP